MSPAAWTHRWVYFSLRDSVHQDIRLNCSRNRLFSRDCIKHCFRQCNLCLYPLAWCPVHFPSEGRWRGRQKKVFFRKISLGYIVMLLPSGFRKESRNSNPIKAEWESGSTSAPLEQGQWQLWLHTGDNFCLHFKIITVSRLTLLKKFGPVLKRWWNCSYDIQGIETNQGVLVRELVLS